MITIVPFHCELAGAFRRLNTDWIERLFAIEAADRKVLDDPQHSIIVPGGQIFFALDGELLGAAGIAWARHVGAESVFLQTNSRLANAVRLYERLGFRHAIDPDPPEYARADVYKVLTIVESGG